MAHQRLRAALLVTAMLAAGDAAADSAGLRVELPTPTTATATARFHVRRSGTGMAPGLGVTMIVVGQQQERVAVGQDATVTVAADARRLTRISVGGKPLLIWLAPGADLWLVDDPCTFWRLDGAWLDSNEAQPPDAYCAVEDRACRDGFDDGSRPRLAHDPVCANGPPGKELKRCVRLAAVRARGAVAIELATDGDDAPTRLGARYRPLHWRGCVGTSARGGGDRVGLVIGPAERWTLSVGDDGRLGGTRDRER